MKMRDGLCVMRGGQSASDFGMGWRGGKVGISGIAYVLLLSFSSPQSGYIYSILLFWTSLGSLFLIWLPAFRFPGFSPGISSGSSFQVSGNLSYSPLYPFSGDTFHSGNPPPIFDMTTEKTPRTALSIIGPWKLGRTLGRGAYGERRHLSLHTPLYGIH